MEEQVAEARLVGLGPQAACSTRLSCRSSLAPRVLVLSPTTPWRCSRPVVQAGVSDEGEAALWQWCVVAGWGMKSAKCSADMRLVTSQAQRSFPWLAGLHKAQ